jgi:glycosyltransferase involved in cell wall biosynthesis
VFHGLSAFHNTVSPAFLAERLGLPVVVFLTNHRLELTDKGGLKGLLGLPRRRRRMARELSALVAMSRAIHEELLEHGIDPRSIARIPMGVDTSQFRPASPGDRAGLRSALGWRALPTVLFVGAVTRRKRPHLLVEALGSLRGRGGECQLVIAGPEHDAGYAAAMRTRAVELGIEHLIVWHGFTPEIAPLYRAADFFALPSEREGMPAALVEAMASGLPAIVTAVSGAVDLVDDGIHGHVVAAEAGAIADALRTYLADPGTAVSHGAAGRRRVERQYSATAVLEAYERLFRRVMAGGDAAE